MVRETQISPIGPLPKRIKMTPKVVTGMLPHHWTVSFLKPRVISFHLVYSAPQGILSRAKYTQHSRYSIYVYSSANKIHSSNSFFF